MITVNFTGSVSETQRRAFEQAASRWDRIIDTSFAPVTVEDQVLDGVMIDASIEAIDGDQGILGQAGPTILRPGDELPIKGIMQFDLADILRLERNNSLEDVILHEMAHVLGFGTLWARMGFIIGSGGNNPQFIGTAATREFRVLGGNRLGNVPVANTGSMGTREGHWRELVFGDELLTGFLSGSQRPISRMSIAAFEDMGYLVDYTEADDYTLPSFQQLAEKGIMEAVRTCDLCKMGRPKPVILRDRHNNLKKPVFLNS
ncbi:peptidase [Amylibacter sp. SFDW26]|uniref:leishmanolysin-related zinc metalloendopeptidase n=1 Tax=Amylibacter sp. SFDW26 TaxID=2652722 RepID=UPI0012624708|nr:leishmanolysin-related zinc metalloendopeptidase [Amylibacter sp. SFDW26]KAB7610401.1 peptidase [Amylibacter sp. SFDW26]